MIQKNTTFILGAGAHTSFGLPTGNNLKSKVANLFDKKNDLLYWMPQYSQGAVNPAQVQSQICTHFSESLKHAGQATIDNFLKANEGVKGFTTIGKAGIARVLLDDETRAMEGFRLLEEDPWINYVFERMINGAHSIEQFLENKISFITFNYDRFLEFELFRKIKSSYAYLSIDEVYDVLKKIPIIHIYGSLGRFNLDEMRSINKNDIGYYAQWMEAFKNIKTIHEVLDDEQDIKNAKHILSNSSTICFLGFGYHKENIDLLGLPEIINRNLLLNVMGSRNGVTRAELEISKGYLTGGTNRKLNLTSNEDAQCYKTLRESIW